MAVIHVDQLAKRFGDLRAIDDLSFEVASGETFGLLGPNGAGKTTTMRVLSGLSPVDSGSVTIAGIDVLRDAARVRRVLGVVTQQDGLDEDLCVRQNLEVFGFMAGLSRRDARRRTAEVLEFFGLSARADDSIDELSGGMKRRLAIARALLHQPRVVILDEPTTGLDPHSRNRVWEELAQLKANGVTILMSTHYMDEAATLCDRIAILDRGRVLALAPPLELIEKYTERSVIELRVTDGTRTSIRTELERAGLSWREVGAVFRLTNTTDPERVPRVAGTRREVRPANLEDVFLKLTGRELRNE